MLHQASSDVVAAIARRLACGFSCEFAKGFLCRTIMPPLRRGASEHLGGETKMQRFRTRPRAANLYTPDSFDHQ
jgi:hypothetical protein